MALNSFINDIVCADEPSEIEIEIKVLLDSRIKHPKYIKSKRYDNDYIKSILEQSKKHGKYSVGQSINFIHTEDTHMFVKQLHFINGVQQKDMKKCYIKKKLFTPIYLESTSLPLYKLSANREIDQTHDINKFDIVRVRLRHSIDFDDTFLKDWRLDLSLIKETRSQYIESIKPIKDKLFTDNSIDKWKIADRIEVELEYTGDITEFNIEKISILDKLWETSIDNYHKYILQIASIIKPTILNRTSIDNLRLKQIGNNPIEITKKMYQCNVLPNISNFVITEKIDGLRSMILLNPKKGVAHIINNTYTCIDIPVGENDLIILDTEMYLDSYYVFDAIYFDKDISKLPFYSNTDCRMNYINKSVELYEFIKPKHFESMTSETFNVQIRNFNNNIVGIHHMKLME